MDKNSAKNALDEIKKTSKKRKFVQSYDLIVALQDLNFKDPTEQVEFFASLTHTVGRKVTVCCLAGPELVEQAKTTCDYTISSHEFDQFSDKKKIKKLGKTYDFFVAQANIMPKVAQVFGRYLGPRGKMPNPKAGCVVPANANLKVVVEKLQKTVKVSARKVPIIQLVIGKEDQPEEEIIDNMLVMYQQLVSHLPKEKNNIRMMYLKTTMGKPVKIQ
jgi:large subunit ribosomal protein L1